MEGELKKIGFLEMDLISTCIYKDGKGSLWLFNHGTYPRIRRYFQSIVLESSHGRWKNDKIEIEDWLSDVFRDYNMKANFTITSVIDANADEVPSEILLEYPEGEIGSMCLKMEFTYTEE